MPLKEVQPEGMFKSGYPSSIAIRTTGGSLLHISGQVSRDDAGKTVAAGDIAGQTHQVIRNLKRVVEDQGGTLNDLCRLVIYATAPGYLRTILEIRAEYFTPPYPAATGVVVSALGSPEWLVEIEATAVLP